MELVVTGIDGPAPDARAAEIVERKGLGHPDSICDALAEELSLALSRDYLARFGGILHHNVDKVLLCGGASQPAFGGGRMLVPIEIHLAGRAALEHRGARVPLEELAIEGSRHWLRRHLHALDADAHVRFQLHIRPGSADLTELFLRQASKDVWLANDTSCGVGYAPLSELERIVLRAERALVSGPHAPRHPAHGEDVKVMGVRHGRRIRLTVACALVDRHLAHADDYLAQKALVARIVQQSAAEESDAEIRVEVNAADDPGRESFYLTVTGTSAEAGDDGEAGRGNRVNGLITPYRPTTLESVAGKNPLSHVGKLYNLAAGLAAEAVVARVPEVEECHCRLVSRIGRPVSEPDLADIALRCRDAGTLAAAAPRAEAILREELAALPSLWRQLLDGTLALDRWPLRGGSGGGSAWDERRDERLAMVREVEDEVRETAHWTGRSRLDPRVAEALAAVPRHAFVPASQQDAAYQNRALPIACGQTISQPYIVALMTDLARIGERDKVLEVGTGSGYQAAVLSRLTPNVHSIENVAPLAAEARARLERLGIDTVKLRCGDGQRGWPERAPFDAILVTAAAGAIPPALLEQLRPGGRLVIPVGAVGGAQELLLVEKDARGELTQRSVLAVAFVPLTTR